MAFDSLRLATAALALTNNSDIEAESLSVAIDNFVDPDDPDYHALAVTLLALLGCDWIDADALAVAIENM